MAEAARRADEADLDDLARLAAAAVDEQREARGGDVWSVRETRPAPYGPSLAAALAADDTAVWAGTYDDVTVGYAACRIEHLRDGRRLGIVTDLVVEPEAREVGVGEALITEVVAWCRDQGCLGIDGWALPGNRETKNFFETFGFKARGIVVHHRLDDG